MSPHETRNPTIPQITTEVIAGSSFHRTLTDSCTPQSRRRLCHKHPQNESPNFLPDLGRAQLNTAPKQSVGQASRLSQSTGRPDRLSLRQASRLPDPRQARRLPHYETPSCCFGVQMEPNREHAAGHGRFIARLRRSRAVSTPSPRLLFATGWGGASRR